MEFPPLKRPFFLVLLFLLLGSSAKAQWKQSPFGNGYNGEAPWFAERFRLSTGTFLPLLSTKVTVRPDNAEATELNFENDLDLKKSSVVFEVDAQFRLGPKTRLDFTRFSLKRSATATIQETFRFGNQDYGVNSRVDGFFNNTLYRVAFGYAFLSNTYAEFGASLGAHVLVTSTGVSAVTSVGGAPAQLRSNDYTFTAPLPDLGIWGGYSINSRLAVLGEASFMSLRVSTQKGGLVSLKAAARYKIFPMLDVSAGYSYYQYKLSKDVEVQSAEIKWRLQGPYLSLALCLGKPYWKGEDW